MMERGRETSPDFSMKLPLSYDAMNEATTWWHWDPVTETAAIQTEQNVDTLIDWNRKQANEVGKTFIGEEGGPGTKVASLPMIVLQMLEAEGRGPTQDWPAFCRWLQDPDNRFFRTHEARLL